MTGQRPIQAQGAAETEFVLDLSRASREDIPRVGVKAANLGELLRAGFPVPEGCVVTTSAFRRFATENGLDDALENSNEGSFGIPPDVSSALSTILGRLGDVLLAVRSSSLNEDLSTSSFAGQYETVLGVKGRGELEEAVKRCWLSIFNRGAKAYRRDRLSEGPSEMAVLIQRLIRADASGVAFTVNPVTGAKEVAVNSVRGLGDRLVSGSAIPDEWLVGEKPVCVCKVENALSEGQVDEVARLAKKVESHFGSPQDIEWAIAGEEVYLLQARPITTMVATEGKNRRAQRIPIPIVVPEGHWIRQKEHFPKPMCPMYASYALTMATDSIRLFMNDVGLPIETIDFRLIGGWVYERIVPPGGKDRHPPPAWLFRILIHLFPSARSQVRKMVETVRADLTSRYLERWNDEWKPELVKKSKELVDLNLASLTDDQLDTHVSATLEHVRHAKEIHFRYMVLGLLAVGDLAITCHQSLGWDNMRVLDMLAGLSEKDCEPSKRLAELVQIVIGDKNLQDAIWRVNQTMRPEEVISIDPAFHERFDLYLKDFGATALGYEVIDPTVGEIPLELLKLIRDQMALNYDPTAKANALQERRNSAEKEAMERLRSLPQDTKTRFTKTLRRARAAYAIRDEEVFYTENLADGIFRRVLLEVGTRLAAKRVVNERDDIFMLTLDEAREALKKGGDFREVAKKRWGERAWAEVNPGPFSYGPPPPPPPPLRVFPPEAQALLHSLMWSLESLSVGKASPATGELRGVAASSGSYVGPVRIVKDESEFKRLEPGDVLVCQSTAPSWSVIFPTIGALVTESGGILSHPAIIAREYGIPAVLALEGATTRLEDGMLVKVDGNAGTVALQSWQPKKAGSGVSE